MRPTEVAALGSRLFVCMCPSLYLDDMVGLKKGQIYGYLCLYLSSGLLQILVSNLYTLHILTEETKFPWLFDTVFQANSTARQRWQPGDKQCSQRGQCQLLLGLRATGTTSRSLWQRVDC